MFSHFLRRAGASPRSPSSTICVIPRTKGIRMNVPDIRELPDMMSASEGGGGSWKSGCFKGGCVNFVELFGIM